MKRVLIISTSLRENSNSEILAREFSRGAMDAANDVSYVSLKGKKIHFCRGCFKCAKDNKCFMNDDVSDIVEEMKTVDVIVFATPIYSNQMCGQLKTLLDRTNPIYESAYRFREIYLLTASTMKDESASKGAAFGIQKWIDCFSKASLKAMVFGTGLDEAGKAIEEKELLLKVYQLGYEV